MSDTVIKVDGLGKMYRIGAARGGMEGPPGLRHELEDSVRRFGRRLRGRPDPKPSTEDFWALKDVSFDVKQGECLGVIGRNGAGKSTLLKVLSRITEPTTGEVRLKGRVGSLLEVGTGFHPELTGRENIFLNGAVLGMSRKEIVRKFDEIVAFSEIEKFLDTPVKRYSSGMYIRLAFAVAAHLEPEILIIDEVLAVGDAAFQKKCLGRMSEVAGHGRTVIFVSHNMAAVRAFCKSAVLLSHGKVDYTGIVEGAVDRYLANGNSNVVHRNYCENQHGIRLTNIQLVDLYGQSTYTPIFGQDYRLIIELDFVQPLSSATLVVHVFDQSGVLVSSLCSAQEGLSPARISGSARYEFNIPHLPLFPKPYSISIRVSRPHDDTNYLMEEDAIRFDVQSAVVNDAMWAYPGALGFVRLADGARLVSLPHSATTNLSNAAGL